MIISFNANSKIDPRWFAAGVGCVGWLALIVSAPCLAQEVTGALGIHDPSTVIQDGSNYFLYGTGGGIHNKWSADGVNWNDESTGVFLTPPTWTTQAVPSFTGTFWAPDIEYFNGKYHLYYSVSAWATIDSAIGVATSTTLDRSSPNYGWTDQGKVVQSDAVWEAGPNTDTTAYNAIDSNILVDTDGSVWMTFGSYSSGILVTQINPLTGKRLNTSTLAATLVANNAPGGGWGSSIEGAALVEQDDSYFLFVNYGGCCSGINSTYDIRVGRSTSPTGPFLDRNGVDMRSGGGTLFLDDNGKNIGPGHFARFTETDGTDFYGFHYYNGDANGAPTYDKNRLYWDAEGWPTIAPNNPEWRGTNSANWSNAANWVYGQVPDGVGSVANFYTSHPLRYSVVLDSAHTVSRVNFRGTTPFTIGSTVGNTLTLAKLADDTAATINVAEGNHAIAAPITTTNNLGINVTLPNSTLSLLGSLSGASLSKYGYGKLVLGGTKTLSGQLSARSGALEVTGTLSTGSNFTIANGAGDTAAMTATGNAQINVARDLNIGDTGDAVTPATGSLVLQGNAAITVGTLGKFVVGSGFFNNTRTQGTVTQSGGTLTANGTADGGFVVGGRSSALAVGTYNLNGGQAIANTNVWLAGYGTGTMNQTGGTFTANSYLAVGRFSGANGIWNISAGQLEVTHASRWLLVGESGTGTLNLSGTGEVSTTNVMRVGHSGGSGTINLNGGSLTTQGIQRGTGTATINFNGGTLFPTANSTTFLQGLTSAKVQAGGAIVDTAGRNITIAQILAHDSSLGATPDGGLRKAGAGTLTLTGANSYTGDTLVEGGTLAIQNPLLSNAADVFVAAGASFNLNFVGTDVIDELFIGGLSKSVGTHGAIGSGADFEWSLFTGTGLLQVTTFAGLAGDFDGDVDVDGRDFLAWQRGESATPFSEADLAAWQTEYNGGLLSALRLPPSAFAVAVPEPGALVLLLGGLLVVGRRRADVTCHTAR